MTSVMSSVMTSVMSSVMTSVDMRRPFAIKGAENHQLISSGKYVYLFIKYLFREYTDKKKKIFSSYRRKFRMDRVQSHLWGRPS
jgi:hypothetical protein